MMAGTSLSCAMNMALGALRSPRIQARMRKPVIGGRARKPSPYAAMDRRLLARLEVSKILRQTEQRIERSRQMLSRNHDTICEWWLFPMPTEITDSVAREENMPTNVPPPGKEGAA